MRNNITSTTLLGLLAVAIPAAAVDQNLVIVSIGDSLAAGEGNPDSFDPLTGKASWVSASCHKSVNNGRRFASNRINSLPGVATSFFDFSCSGAKIGDQNAFLPGGGLLSPQQTAQPNVNNFLVGAQVDRVRDFQQNTLHGRAIDILMISVGVNDVNFEAVVKACLENTPGGDCTASDAVNTSRNILRSTEFPKEYDDLAAAIAQLNVKHVYITEYPDEVTIQPMDFCGLPDVGDISMQGVSKADSQFLLTEVLGKLNTQIQQAAARHGWRLVQGPMDTFATHGFCTASSRRYVNTALDSMLRQGDQNGTMHPNIAGHEAYADALVARATVDFNLHLEAPRPLRRVESNVGIPGPEAVPFVTKAVTVEIAQHPGTLSVTLHHRVDNVFGAGTVSSTTMTETGAGRLNLFSAQIPGSNTVVPFAETLKYQFVITATRNGETQTLTTQWFSVGDEILVQQ